MSKNTDRDALFDVSGKRVLITAAASGMGRAATQMFASRGAQVIAVDVNADGLDGLAKELEAEGIAIETQAVDLGDLAAVGNFADELLGRDEVLDVLYNHAGLRGQTELDYDEDGLLATTTINLITPMMLTKRLLPLLRKSSSASLIYTASISGLRASAGLPIYGATKAGLISYMKSMAVLLGPEGIRSNAICPGATRTAGMLKNNSVDSRGKVESMIPLRRMGDPEDDAAAALYLASDASRYVTGVAIPVDGGLSL
ncbi:MAG: SDR family NAD(P)-dependent oxidoreductase [Gulosibacter sp.]|uniref:SDR family NAD(P)-dependent oxidoreductase n=1 Tax=Gulosibacter sp. TaxID=2817531 RepID=UPI003F8DB33E